MQCSVKRYSGRGRGCKDPKGQRELCKQEFPGGDERGLWEDHEPLATIFPSIRAFLQRCSCAIEHHNILYSSDIKLCNLFVACSTVLSQQL